MSAVDKSGSLLDQLAARHTNRSLADQLVEEAEQRRAADAAAEMSTQELFSLRLHRRIQRLSQIVALQAPPVFLVTEILLLQDSVESAYPDEVALVLVQRMKARAKERLGRCVHDTCEKPASTDPAAIGYCTEHLKQLEAETTG